MTPRILLVEDNADDVDLTIAVFKQIGFSAEIDVVEDGIEAIEYLSGTGRHEARGPGLPLMILLDLNLPRMHGLELLQHIREERRTRRVPIVVLTSSGEEHDISESYDRGANSYIRKPVDLDQFRDLARQLDKYWLRVNTPPPEPST